MYFLEFLTTKGSTAGDNESRRGSIRTAAEASVHRSIYKGSAGVASGESESESKRTRVLCAARRKTEWCSIFTMFIYTLMTSYCMDDDVILSDRLVWI